jgi:hypothetical protein
MKDDLRGAMMFPDPIRSDDLLTITIYVEEDTGSGKHITYRPAVLSAHHGDRLMWKSDAGPFDIEFKGPTPVRDLHITSHASGRGYETDAYGIQPDAHRGCYSYAVTGTTEGDRYRTNSRYIDAGCPEIIIED